MLTTKRQKKLVFAAFLESLKQKNAPKKVVISIFHKKEFFAKIPISWLGAHPLQKSALRKMALDHQLRQNLNNYDTFVPHIKIWHWNAKLDRVGRKKLFINTLLKCLCLNFSSEGHISQNDFDSFLIRYGQKFQIISGLFWNFVVLKWENFAWKLIGFPL